MICQRRSCSGQKNDIWSMKIQFYSLLGWHRSNLSSFCHCVQNPCIPRGALLLGKKSSDDERDPECENKSDTNSNCQKKVRTLYPKKSKRGYYLYGI